MSVSVVYCIELERDVTIMEARNEFFAKPQDQRQKFTFLCNDPDCRQPDGSRTEMVGVNYTRFVADSESTEYKSPYFRLKPKQEHSECCRSVTRNEEENESDSDSIEKNKKRNNGNNSPKENLLIDYFILPDDEKIITQKAINTTSEGGNKIRNQDNINATTSSTPSSTRKNINQTSLLDTLVYSYIEAKNILSRDKFLARELTIKKHGRVKLNDYFLHILKYMGKKDAYGIAFGGCSIGKIYGNLDSKFGFTLFFYDQYDKRNISTYIDSSMLEEYRYKNTIAEILKQYNNSNYYLRAYFLNPTIEFNSEKNRYDILIQDLRFLSLIPIKKKS